MTTIAAAIKEGVVAIAADTLTSGGSMMSQDYLKECDKIVTINESFVGFSGYSASIMVIEHLMRTEPEKFQMRSRFEIFSTLIRVHKILRDDYFINATAEQDKNPTETNQLYLLVANQYGIFSADENRDVQSFSKFWAMGSGGCYALGAMEALYEQEGMTAVELVTKAIETSAKFDSYTALPYQVLTVPYQPEQPIDDQVPNRMMFKMDEKQEAHDLEQLFEQERGEGGSSEQTAETTQTPEA